jgi:hypothetical protein
MLTILKVGASVLGLAVFLYLVFWVVAWGVVPWIWDKFTGRW